MGLPGLPLPSSAGREDGFRCAACMAFFTASDFSKIKINFNHEPRVRVVSDMGLKPYIICYVTQNVYVNISSQDVRYF